MFRYDDLEQMLPQLRHEYATARPFPHVTIDDACDVMSVDEVVADWPSPDDKCWGKREEGNLSNLKHGAADIAKVPKWIRYALACGNSERFTRLLSKITGIDKLVADDHFGGAGIHETHPPGFLAVHLDFNRSARQRLYRRVNMFLYLNHNWQDEWNGHLELWKSKSAYRKSDMRKCVKIAPEFNRLVICEASERTWHGHPERLACPEGMSRKSLAWYMYTEAKPEDFTEQHSTVYVKRRK